MTSPPFTRAATLDPPKLTIEIGLGQKARIMHRLRDRCTPVHKSLTSLFNAYTIHPLRHVLSSVGVDDPGHCASRDTTFASQSHQVEFGISI